jgi:hypothetical protein
MIQSLQELPLILPTNTSDITFLTDELRTRCATCRGFLNHTEGSAQYTILGSGRCNGSDTFDVVINGNVTSAEAGSVELALKENGTPVVGASANATIATPGDYSNFTIMTTIRLCPRENVTLTVGSVPAVSGVTPTVETVAPTVKNVKINISKHIFS